MLQKCAILGLVLLLAGGAAFGWLYRETQNERRQAQGLARANSLGSQEYLEKYGRWYQLSPEQQNQLVLELDKERKSKSADQLGREQQARLTADLDKLAAGQMNPGDIADFLYGRGWEGQVEQYKMHREQMEAAQTIAIVCLSTGGVLFGSCTVVWLLRLPVRAIRALQRRSAEPELETERKMAELTDIELHDSEPQGAPDGPASQEQPRQRRKRLTLSEADNCGFEHALSPNPQSAIRNPQSLQVTGADSGVALLLADEPSDEGGWSAEAQWSLTRAPEVPSKNVPQERHPTRRSTVRQPEEKGDSTVRDTRKEQAEDLQKQIAEFKQMAQNVQQAREQSAPLNNTLKELTQQVSAIREYAASQQDRVEKLQDGYDWGIIRTFCLRVIRCIDNLEGRLAGLPKDDSAARHLEEVRDELLFALESSGVEQFRPEVNSEFHGQEKRAEALKEKQPAKKPELAGRIARVIRPGYRYMMDDENYRVVRTAQVKVYG
jgi:molecular chaperone GrpE (heat shock protein)